MNVRIVCPQFTPFGGTQLAIWQLGRYLRGRDHSVRVMAFSADAMPGVEMQRIPDPMFSGISRILALRRAAKRDLRHEERRYATGPDDPTAHVVTFHACAKWRLQQIGARRVRFSGRSVRDWLRPLYHRAYLTTAAELERRIVLRALSGELLLTAVSSSLGSQIRAAYGEDVPIVVTPNGVDRTDYSPAAAREHRAASRNHLGFKDEDFVVGFVGGDWHRKNLDTFIRAVDIARVSVPRIKGAVLGHGDAGAFANSRAIRFAGVNRNPIEFYGAIDVFYSPSPVESFGLPALEAAACGIPVVICGGVGLLDFLEAGEAVVLRDPFDPDSAADALIRLHDDDSLRQALSTAGLRAAERLPWSRPSAAIEALLLPPA